VHHRPRRRPVWSRSRSGLRSRLRSVARSRNTKSESRSHYRRDKHGKNR
jgi:hypothetical protein